jgi:hypothetical protein
LTGKQHPVRKEMTKAADGMAVSYADIVKGKSAALAADDKTVTAAHVRHGTLRGVDSLWLLVRRDTARARHGSVSR